MKDLGTESPTISPVSETKQKTVIRYPKVTLTSKQFPSLKGLALKPGMKCTLTFAGEVDGFQTASDWEIREQGLRKDDILVTFELMKGEVSLGANKDEPKSIEGARRQMMKESAEGE